MNASVWNGSGRRIRIQEVGPRDGLQMEARFVPTKEKIALINALSSCGLEKIEVTSFTSPAAVPALRDAEVVMREIERRPGVMYTALVPNVRGTERAIEARADEVNLVMSVSETHNRCNLRMSRSQSLSALTEAISLARSSDVPTNVSLSCVFGCPMEGDVSKEEVSDWIQRFVDMGVQGITLCDTTGMAFPLQVVELATHARLAQYTGVDFTLHFHNTRGMGLANLLAAISTGLDRFDAALGGLGGCPYAPGASGNVCTEEIVHALDLMGYDTGIDLSQLVEAAARLPSLVGHDVPSQIVRAGLRLDLHPIPNDAGIKSKPGMVAAGAKRQTVDAHAPSPLLLTKHR
ncbi:hydroxymethylglutaryl-CoA lyase [Hydrogenophaga crocea]|jgi:hydroxymethylglutaryl-CoA lyase|uniref:Hydroxymethylglutaryl-CoA lyase n=1 Tax=Hydrogenophaga crocea TaxID=2716225 RepID=A0A6G8IJ08_9BURK|nr:hydroxymethylglutaryl-CoA lyase [Hydrogenophaga crocea]QIM53184.1 hydroxymethylglutaryl-CoA lyase [Hydrogenophaga crocea]